MLDAIGKDKSGTKSGERKGEVTLADVKALISQPAAREAVVDETVEPGPAVEENDEGEGGTHL